MKWYVITERQLEKFERLFTLNEEMKEEVRLIRMDEIEYVECVDVEVSHL